MRLVSWNCNLGFRGRKVEALLALAPDVAVIQECAQRDVEALANAGFAVAWDGTNPRKGHAVVARPGVAVRVDGCHDPELAYFLPVTVGADGAEVRLLALWAFHRRAPTAKPWPLYEALAHYEPFFATHPAIVAGDFNFHPIWDTPARPTFGRTLDVLGRAGLRSAWHDANGREHGDEGCGTLYWYRHAHRPYHIDYCFVSPDVAVTAAEVGPTGEWLALSDHCPVVVDVER